MWSTLQQPSMQSSHHYSTEHNIYMHVNENNSQLSSAHEPLLQALQNWSRHAIVVSTVGHGGSRWKIIAGFFDHGHYGKQTDANLSIISVDCTAISILIDPFWKYNAQCFCLVVEHVQTKLIQFGQRNRQRKCNHVQLSNALLWVWPNLVRFSLYVLHN